MKKDKDTSRISSSAAPLAVITVTFSPGRHLSELAASLDQATSGNSILVCADNGSTDGVPEQIAAQRTDVEWFSTGGNIGYGAAINAAVKRLGERRKAGLIKRDYFLITNPDVVFTAGSIDALLDCITHGAHVGSVGPKIQEADGSAYPSARQVPGLLTGIGHALLGNIWPSNPFTSRYKAEREMDMQRRAGWLSGACLLVRWDAFETIGGFDERYFMYLEDVDFGDRLSRAGWENIFCPASVILHDQGHVASKHSRVTVPAHHASAYRFQADRHPAWWQAPLRLILWLGLSVRGSFQLTRS